MTKMLSKTILGVSIITSILISNNLKASENNKNPLLNNNKKIEIINKKLFEKINNNPIFRNANIKVESIKEVHGLYEVTAKTIKGQIFKTFITKDFKLLIHSGQTLQTKDGMPYKAPVNISKLEGNEAFTYGNGSKTIYVFTDPQCPFCKRFEKQWVNLKDKYTIKVFINPLDSIHPEANAMTHWILSAKTDKEKAERLISIANGSKEYKVYQSKENVSTYKKIEKKIKEQQLLAKKNGLTGTPTVLDTKGEFLNWTLLEKPIKEITPSENIKDTINNSEVFKRVNLKVTKIIPLNDLYIVQARTAKGQKLSLIFSKDLKIFIHSAKILDIKTGQEYQLPISVNDFKDKNLFTYGSGPKTIYVFTDPQCPFCQTFEKEWDKLKDKYTIKVFINTLDSIHSEANAMTHWILSAKTDKEKAERLKAIANGSKEYKAYQSKENVTTYKEIEKQIKEQKQIARENGITGTPTVLDENGKKLHWNLLK